MSDDPNSSPLDSSDDSSSNVCSTDDSANATSSSGVCAGNDSSSSDSSSTSSSDGPISSDPPPSATPVESSTSSDNTPFIGPPADPNPPVGPVAQTSETSGNGDTSGTSPSSTEFANADDAAANSCSETPLDSLGPTCDAPKATLAVKVTDPYNRPLADADVEVEGVSEGRTDEHGIADFGEVAPKTYNITVQKDGFRPDSNAVAGPAQVPGNVPAGSATVVPVQLFAFTENLIFVGSEMDYDSFWLKMMFIASAWFQTSNSADFRTAGHKTVAYVDNGYTRFEKLTIDYLRQKLGFDVIKLGGSDDIVQAFNNRLRPNASGVKEYCYLQDVAFFSHGQPDGIKLNFNSSPDVTLSEGNLASTNTNIFTPDGRLYSYACRTGVSSWKESFGSDAGAGLDNSLAQKIANHFQIETHAFLRRSNYGEVLREKAASAAISGSLKASRATQDGQLIEIPPEHQGLPHSGLADGWFNGAKKEGTNEYALWRKAGGIRLPRSGDSPSGLSTGQHVFTPK